MIMILVASSISFCIGLILGLKIAGSSAHIISVTFPKANKDHICDGGCGCVIETGEYYKRVFAVKSSKPVAYKICRICSGERKQP